MIRAWTRAASWAALIGLAALTACGSSEKTGPEPPAETVGPGAVSNKKELEKTFEEARQLELRGDYKEANALFEEVKKSDPDYKDVSEVLKDYDKLISCQEGITIARDDSSDSLLASAHADLGEALRARDISYWAQALSQYEKALELNPDNFKANFGMAKLYFQGGYLERAIKSYTRAAELDGSTNDEKAEAHFQLAFMHNTATDSAAAKPDLALKNARLAVEYSANDALEYRRVLANLLLDADQIDEAIKIAEDIVSREGANDGDKKRVERLLAIAKDAGGAKPEGEETPETTPGEDKPADTTPVEPKPEEPKPEEPKPEEPKPAEPTEPKPVEPKPAEPTEPKPAEPKPEEPKPEEPKPAPSEPDEPGGDDPDDPGSDDPPNEDG